MNDMGSMGDRPTKAWVGVGRRQLGRSRRDQGGGEDDVCSSYSALKPRH